MGGGSSSSSSASTNTTTNVDKRLVVSDSGIGLSSDSSTVHITMQDQGAIRAAGEIAARGLDAGKLALDAVSSSGKLSAANYEALLNNSSEAFAGIFKLADTALAGGFKSLDSTQAGMTAAINKTLAGMAAAVDTQQSKGTLDNRTITILGVSAAVAVAAYAIKKG